LRVIDIFEIQTMITFEEYQILALSFPDVTEEPHFEARSFRIRKKIFGTYWPKEHKAMLRLSLENQSVFCAYDSSAIYPVPGTWGKQGATFFDLHSVDKELFADAVQCAFDEISKRK
jgi:hypothetical protein